LRKAHAGLDPQTHQEINAAMQAALETHLSGRSREWSSANSDYSGRLTPVRTWRSRSGHFCRAFVEIVRLPTGIERNSRGRACRNDAGIWVRI
jgi:surface antigen